MPREAERLRITTDWDTAMGKLVAPKSVGAKPKPKAKRSASAKKPTKKK